MKLDNDFFQKRIRRLENSKGQIRIALTNYIVREKNATVQQTNASKLRKNLVKSVSIFR